MGQPKFNRSKVDTPSHPWQGDRIKAENEVVQKFGLKNKTEIWRAQTRLREMRGQARLLVARARNPSDAQAAREAGLLLARLNRQGYLGENATLNDVLGLDLERILNRRLQSQVYLKGLARTPKQARQFVSHGCIKIGERRVTVPSYVVRRGEEEQIHIDPTKAIADESHPVRPKAAGTEMAAPPASAASAAPAAPAAPAAAAASTQGVAS
ncbi:MAG TPA: 30S ribosomal protein S4 [Candidatus Thermoplasmatota archaeon]|nr:30S ribosomal protein S4 [Candidatus Thermoplasmatota archaeon]